MTSPKASRSPQKPPESFKRLQKTLEPSRSLQKTSEAAKRLQTAPEASKRLQNTPETPKGSRTLGSSRRQLDSNELNWIPKDSSNPLYSIESHWIQLDLTGFDGIPLDLDPTVSEEAASYEDDEMFPPR